MYKGRIKKIHFIGIGGSGMSGIAEVLCNMGYTVSGSDLKSSAVTRRLASLGVDVQVGHAASNVVDVDCVVYSSAVKYTNPEMEAAVKEQIPIIARAEMLAELMRMKYGVAVAGTHGKTTTTSIIASILARAGLDPTVVTGGKLNHLGSGAKLGKGEFLVAEADESDGSFLKLSPTIAVVTNIDREHMEHYSDMEEVKASYLDFVNKVPFYGCAVVCLDHPTIQELLPLVSRRYVTYGLSAQADVRAVDISHKQGKTSFEVIAEGESIGRVVINMPGEHNVCNALGAVAVAMELSISSADIIKGLKEFTGVERRFQIIGTASGVTVVDDYGHHPVEIKAVLKSIKDGWKGKRAVIVFQPHRYSRTKDLFRDFTTAFNDADLLVVTNIYGAGEECGEEGNDGAKGLYRAIKEHGHRNVTYIDQLERVSEYLLNIVKPGDMVVTLGAGDVWTVAENLIDALKDKEAAGDEEQQAETTGAKG